MVGEFDPPLRGGDGSLARGVGARAAEATRCGICSTRGCGVVEDALVPKPSERFGEPACGVHADLPEVAGLVAAI